MDNHSLNFSVGDCVGWQLRAKLTLHQKISIDAIFEPRNSRILRVSWFGHYFQSSVKGSRLEKRSENLKLPREISETSNVPSKIVSVDVELIDHKCKWLNMNSWLNKSILIFYSESYSRYSNDQSNDFSSYF